MNADCAEFVPRTPSGYTFMVRSGDGRRSSTSMVDRVVLDDELAQITFDASNASGVIQIDRNRKSFQQQLHSEQTEIEEINYKFYAQFHHKDLNMQIAPKLSQKKKTSNPANSYNKLWIPPAYLMYAAPLPWPCQYPPYDTLQRSSSNGNQQQSTLANCEITNELVINHNQKLSGSKSSKGHHRSNLGGRDGGGGSSKRHDKVMNSSTPHPWLVTTLKGHTDQIRDVGFSGNGKYLASCGEDRTILIWSCSNIEDAKNRKCLRINTEYDSGIKLAWSPDNRAIVIHKMIENCIEVYKVEKKNGWFCNPTKGITFPKVTDSDIIGFGIACTGKFLMTCTNETELFIWDLKGNVLDKLDTYLITTYSAKVSPCGRFIGACGFAPSCKVWEVKFSKSGEYQKTERIFDLSGHNSGIYDFAFDQDTSHIVTVGKDGTWILYDTNVEYDKGQSPRRIKSGKYTCRGSNAIAALSLNAEVIAIATLSNIELFSTVTGECDAVIKDVFESPIVTLSFDSVGKLIFVGGHKQVKVYHNITGYKTSIAIAEAKLKGHLTAATKERFQNQLSEYKDFLKKFS